VTAAWAWPLLILGLAGWIIAAAEATAISFWLAMLGRPTDTGDDLGYATLPATNEKPPAPALDDPSPAQGPGIHPHYAAQLDAISKRMVMPGIIDAARIVADELREQFPAVDDLTLGLVSVHLYGFARTLTVGLSDDVDVAQVVVDLLGLTADDLTRLARTDSPQ
jgi:hypothetical protein